MEQEQLFMRRPGLNDLPSIPALPSRYRLRLAHDADVVGLASIMTSAFGPEWTVDHVREKLVEPPDVVRTWLITRDDEAAATASARLLPGRYPGSGYLHWVGTHRAHRGKALGAIVTLAVLRDFHNMGCHDAVLETDPPRLPAIQTYLKLGFQPESRAAGQEAIWNGILMELAAYHTKSGTMPRRTTHL